MLLSLAQALRSVQSVYLPRGESAGVPAGQEAAHSLQESQGGGWLKGRRCTTVTTALLHRKVKRL